MEGEGRLESLFLNQAIGDMVPVYGVLSGDVLGTMAADPGFEPGFRVPETRVIPLHQSAV